MAIVKRLVAIRTLLFLFLVGYTISYYKFPNCKSIIIFFARAIARAASAGFGVRRPAI